AEVLEEVLDRADAAGVAGRVAMREAAEVALGRLARAALVHPGFHAPRHLYMEAHLLIQAVVERSRGEQAAKTAEQASGREHVGSLESGGLENASDRE